MAESQEKLPPRNEDAEVAVIGSLLIDGELIRVAKVEPGDFYYEQNSLMFKAMLGLKEKGVAINQITVAQKLAEMDKLEAIGGAAELSRIIAITPTSLDCDQYANIVKRLSVCRQLITVGEIISASGYETPDDTTALLAKADSTLLKLRQHAGGTTIITPDDRAHLLMERYEKLYLNEKGVALRTGLIDLDARLGGGLFPGELVILAARPKMGKTSMLECITNYIASDHNVLFCSAEMNVEGLSDRDVAGQVGVPIETIRYGGYSSEVYDDIVGKAIPYISDLKVYYMDITRSDINSSNIYQAAYELKARHGLSLVVIDYLGLLTDRYGNNNNDRIGYITRNLKQTALGLEVPILCACQLNRTPESREEKRPQLSDLRDSGNIEQDADVVLFLYRESYYKKTDDNVTEILIGAQRQGASMKRVKVVWDDKVHTYRNMAREEEPQTEKLI